VSPTHHALLGGMLLCLTGPGSAVITSIVPVHPTGTIEVLGYAARPNPLLNGGDLLGTDYGTLRAHGFTAERTVNAPCGASDSGQGDEVAVELAVPPGTDAGTTGWEIDYRIGGHASSTTFPQGAVLCSTPAIDDEPCKRVRQRLGLSW
jgi:hypothetical protein